MSVPLPISNALPDPYAPFMRVRSAPAAANEAGVGSALYRRRAEILAATRRTLAEEGHQRFTLRSVSEACSVTAQTIHNSFGSKVELLRAALNQHTQQIDGFALSQINDPLVFLALARAYYESAIEWGEFMREFMLVTSSRPSLRDALFKYGAELKVHILRGMARRNLLRSSVDPRMAAEQIAYVNMFGMREWAETGDLKRLEERLISGNAILLLGIFKPEAARGVEQWLGGVQQETAEAGSPLLS